MAISPTEEEKNAVREARTPLAHADVVQDATHNQLFARYLANDSGQPALAEAHRWLQWYDMTTITSTADLRQLWDEGLERCEFSTKQSITADMQRPTMQNNEGDDDIEATNLAMVAPKFHAAADELRAQLDGWVPGYRQALSDEMVDAIPQDGSAPDPAVVAQVQSVNEQTIKNDRRPDASWPYRLCGELLFVGDNHDSNTYNYYFTYFPPTSEGWITVQRARIGAGSFVINGCSAADQPTVRQLLGQFSDKKIQFI
jgi:hypothetical protein